MIKILCIAALLLVGCGKHTTQGQSSVEQTIQTDDYKVIKGLYATGNNVSGVSVAAYQNVEGIGLGFSLTSGRLAGQAAAEYAKK